MAAALSLAFVVLAPGLAHAKATVLWTRIEVPERDDASRLKRTLKDLLSSSSKKANFGRRKSVTLVARLVEFSVEERGDVLQVRCTIAGRIVGGAGARSRISFGGSPKDRRALEDQVLKMVANGLVTRLAQISRAETEAEGKAATTPTKR
jgi:hypothetical protein